jgi:M6 family metalloprotease-like protein/uncharacterized delta-60 repeat protein
MTKRTLHFTLLAAVAMAFAAFYWVAEPQKVSVASAPEPPVRPKLKAPDSFPITPITMSATPEVFGKDWSQPRTDALRVFTDWVGRYQAADEAVRSSLLAEGVRLAQARRQTMAQMIMQNPEAALAAAVPIMTRKNLPPEIVAQLEERVSGQGDLALICVTPAPGSQEPGTTIRSAYVNEKEYRVHTYGKRARVASLPSASLHGVAIDGQLALSESPVRMLEPGEMADGRTVNRYSTETRRRTPASADALHSSPEVAVEVGGQIDLLTSKAEVTRYAAQLHVSEQKSREVIMADNQPGTSTVTGRPAIAWTHGTKKLLIIIVDFSDKMGRPVNPFDTQSITENYAVDLVNSANGVKDFYEQGSYGKTSISMAATVSNDSPDVTSVLRMPKTAAYYATNYAVQEMHSAARTLAQNAGFNVDSYDRIGVVFADLRPPQVVGGAGIAGSKFTFSGLGGNESKNFWINGFYTFSVVAHEIGHNYGLNHASLWQVADGNPVSPSGTVDEYGDNFDVMGDGDNITHHFSQWNKSLMQWIPDSGVSTINSSGTYRVYRFDSQSANLSNTLALKVVRNRELDYWIGYRRATSNTSLDNGAYVLWGYNQNDLGKLLDMTTPGTNVNDAALGIGASFNDSAAGITLQTIAQGGTGADEWLDVQVTIQPRISWTLSEYIVNEQGASAVLTLTRSNNASGAISVNYATSNGTATTSADYTNSTGTVNWANGDTANKTVTIPVVADAVVEGTETFNVSLNGITGGVIVNSPTAVVRLADPGAKDPTFTANFINSTVERVLALPDGNLLAGGWFTQTYDGLTSYNRGGIALFNSKGATNPLFASEGGATGGSAPRVLDLARQPDGKIITVGSFTTMHGVTRGNIARLNADGSLDPAFATGAGANGAVWAALVQTDGKILIGGEFTTYNGTNREYLARLNADGTLDTGFIGPDFQQTSGLRVESLALLPDKNILVGGYFYLTNQAMRKSGICKVSENGVLDSTFSAQVTYGTTPNDLLQISSVEKIYPQADGKIYIVGDFTKYNNVARRGIARLNATGSLDTGFTTTTNGEVHAIYPQPDGKFLLGGTFTTINGSTATRIGRINAAGTTDTAFSAAGGVSQAVEDFALLPDGAVVFGSDFATFQGSIEELPLWKFLAGLPGLPGVLQFSSESFSGVEGTTAAITVSRTGGSSGALTLSYQTLVGTATTADFTSASGILTWADGDAANKTISIPITSDALVDSGETFKINLGLGTYGPVILDAVQQTTVTVGTAFDSWKSSQFSPVELANASLSGDLGDLEADGIENLLEFAFNLSPRTSSTSGLPTIGKTNVSGSDYLTVTFRRRTPALDLTYTPQTNGTLPGTWQSNAVQVGSAVSNGDGTETVTFRDVTPMGQVGSPTRFLRVRVSRAQ